jgi:hypothetical protein
MPRVPATLSEAQAALAQATPHPMLPRRAGDRAQLVHATDGGVAPRWAWLYSAPRPPQAQRTADKPWRQQSDQALHAFQTLGHTALACEAEARPALSACAHGWPVTPGAQVTSRPLARYGTRGRPGLGAQPAPLIYPVAGALAASLAARQARITPPSCVILATHERDDPPLPPPERRDGDKGQRQAERGCRFLNAPQCLASSR